MFLMDLTKMKYSFTHNLKRYHQQIILVSDKSQFLINILSTAVRGLFPIHFA